MPASRGQQRLYVNIDHVATLRQARRGDEPDPVAAALLCEAAGADGITAHLREDRRHIQDDDAVRLRARVTSYLNLELACTDEMVAAAVTLRPDQATFVPERREEVTTEGGLDVAAAGRRLADAVTRLRDAGIRVSLFVDPDDAAVDATHRVGADAVELHTGAYALRPGDPAPIAALRAAARRAHAAGLAVHAGHGLSAHNLAPVAAIPEVEELNIGHSIVSRAISVGLPAAIAEVRGAMRRARAGGGSAPGAEHDALR